MTFAIALVIIVTIIALILTFILVGRGDSDYNDKSKRNITNLTIVYTIAIVLSFIALAMYIF